MENRPHFLFDAALLTLRRIFIFPSHTLDIEQKMPIFLKTMPLETDTFLLHHRSAMENMNINL
jgi:hypothetical protein